MSVIQAAKRLAHYFKQGSTEGMAKAMNKPYSTLRNELSEIGTSKLGLRDAVLMSVLSGDMQILTAFAEAMNAVAFPMPAVEAEGDTSDDLMFCMSGFGNYVTVVSEVSSGPITPNGLKRVDDASAKLIGSVQNVRKGLGRNLARPDLSSMDDEAVRLRRVD